MDVLNFSREDFSAAEWINRSYKEFIEEKEVGRTDEDDFKLKNSFINSYISKLEFSVKQVKLAVEDTNRQVIANMSRIIKGVNNLHTNVQRLQERMVGMRREVAAVEKKTGECMETLERLNKQQAELQAAKESLLESDGWSNLIAELEDCFERNDLQNICDKLLTLQKSAIAQEKLDGHIQRQAQVEDFKNRLEALASPSVIQVFKEGDIGKSRNLVDIFANIQRLPQLKQYYRAVQKNSLQQHWKEILERVGSDSSEQFLILLYDRLLEMTKQQVKWCSQVFDTTIIDGMEPILVIIELLPALQPSRDQHILQMLRISNERLELLERIARAQERFVNQLNAYLKQSNIELSEETMKLLSDSIHEYFYNFIRQYPSLEEIQLSTQVDRLMTNQTMTAEAVRHLDNGTRKVFIWLADACDRCGLITKNLALCKLITLIDSVLRRLLEHFSKTQRQLSLSIADASEGDWSLLQQCLSLLQCLGDFQHKLNKLEQILNERLIALTEQITNTSRKNCICILSVFDHNELKRILSIIEEYHVQRTGDRNLSQSLGIFSSLYMTLRSHFSETHEIVFSILLRPIEIYLSDIHPLYRMKYESVQVDMPTFSFSPQEYITQVGQYLLTLPQHLEPLLLSPSPLLRQALELSNMQYAQQVPCADILLQLVVEECCSSYQLRILQIKNIGAAATKQLAVDIEYLSNVVEELGLNINQHLSQILTLLKASPDSYLSSSRGCEPHLVTAIRQMRNVMSTQ